MSTRQYLEDHPEVVAQLRDRTLLAKDLAAQLGIRPTSLSKVLTKMNIVIRDGAAFAARNEASAERQERDVHLQRLVDAVLAGKMNADDAADAAGCSKDTIWRHIRRRKAESL
ncbi:hypothetical protein [Cupriavidus basilensis]|uniref:hypothetical protein n=1 Tax=Cupriavidus basilensis TaxID=68895 RepID=UPI0020A694B6|nr:hypothetical protein [Cupriavidus basilensis]MCP3024968.1 hypothetical protein [Cupriavidus basilensis]